MTTYSDGRWTCWTVCIGGSGGRLWLPSGGRAATVRADMGEGTSAIVHAWPFRLKFACVAVRIDVAMSEELLLDREVCWFAFQKREKWKKTSFAGTLDWKQLRMRERRWSFVHLFVTEAIQKKRCSSDSKVQQDTILSEPINNNRKITFHNKLQHQKEQPQSYRTVLTWVSFSSRSNANMSRLMHHNIPSSPFLEASSKVPAKNFMCKCKMPICPVKPDLGFFRWDISVICSKKLSVIFHFRRFSAELIFSAISKKFAQSRPA